MIKDNTYNTYGASFDGANLIYYCYNKNTTSIEEIAELQYIAFLHATNKRYKLFHKYENFETDIELRVCLN